MFRFWGILIGVVAAVGGVTAHAQSSSVPLSAEQVQAEFARAGYQVDQAVQWTWSSPGLTTFRVLDSDTDRVLMVFVYPDQAAADTAREQAGRFEADQNPRLIAGYGPSQWQANVAMVQSSESRLRRMAGADYEREMAVIVSSGNYQPELIAEPRESAYAVDVDFGLLLTGALLNL